MKKVFLTIVAVATLCATSYATEKKVDFIYIHGANQGAIERFEECVNKMHPIIKKDFENNDFINIHMLKGSAVNEKSDILYWADKTHSTKSAIDRGLAQDKKYSSSFIIGTKTFLAYLLHDSVWVQQYVNMRPILDDLHKNIIANYKKGEKTIIVGYSAGTFISYEYMMNKYKYINPYSFTSRFKKELKLSNEDLELIRKYSPETTCVSAIIDSQIAVFDGNGNLIASPDKSGRKERITKLKEQTNISCAPDDAVIGVINFASPLTAFYSQITKENSQAQLLTLRMSKYIIENDKFFMTLNYVKDPLGIPYKNTTYAEIEQLFGNDIKNNNGFLYNKSLRGGRNIAVGHSMYWIKPNPFIKEFVKAYKEGYNKFYGIN